jgi:hypothetical protein
MFLTLSEEFRDNVADVEMKNILEFLQLQIQQSLLLNNYENQTITQQVSLPQLLGRGLRYSIEIRNTSNNEIELHGFSTKFEVNRLITFPIKSSYLLTIPDSSYNSANNMLNLFISISGHNLNIQIS